MISIQPTIESSRCPPRRRGRPSKLARLGNEIIAYVRRGHFVCVAAEACGLDRGTIYRWLRLGKKDPNGPYGDFRRALKRAAALGEMDLLDPIDSNEPNWQRLAWRLERLHPRRYGRKRVEIIRVVRKPRPRKSLDAIIQEARRLLAEHGLAEVDAQLVLPAGEEARITA